MTRETRRAFTLIELMLVMGIIALMGTISVNGYRAMRRGMEEDGTMKNLNLFVRNAYERAMIDRQPTAIYFWNETRREENDDGNSLLVVGRAVAVRRAGRVSYVDNGKSCLVDEFGDLRYYAGTDSEGDEDAGEEAKEGIKSYIYKVNGNESSFKRYAASQATMAAGAQSVLPMMSDPEWSENSNHRGAKVSAYGYYLEGGAGDWKAGDAYGFEFADITLPNNYIFESTYSKSVADPVKTVSKVLRFSPSGGAGGQSITVYAIRPGKSGAPEAQKIGATESPDKKTSNE